MKRAAPAADGGAVVDLESAAEHIEGFLRALGHAPESDVELRNTGRQVANAFHRELLSGHRMDPAQILAETLATGGDDLLVVRDIDVTCICPHHLLPASGVVHVGYVPSGKIVGLGAIARLAECFARRLTLQETLCDNVADALMTHLGARGAGCIAVLAPACLTTRGERPAHARVISSAMRGTLRDDKHARAELFAVASVQPAEPSR